MQFLLSLFCWQGFDNRIRFGVIQLASLLFILISIQSSLVFALFVITLSAVVTTFSAKRRLCDVETLTQPWLLWLAPLSSITYVVIALLQHGALYTLLILPIAYSAYLISYQSKRQRHYIFGYNGPVDLSSYASGPQPRANQSNRIEPVFNQQQSTAPANDIDYNEAYASASSSGMNTSIDSNQAQAVDYGEIARLWLMKNKLVVIIAAVVILLSTIAAVIFSQSNQQAAIQEPEVQIIEQEDVMRLHPVDMPDNFTLLLSQYNGVIVNWQADEVTDKELWHIEKTEGDTSCQEISFNNGDKIRTTSVVVEGGQNYFANFSPLDTGTLLKNVAFRGKFTLCGYTFSLKGSQAALGKHPIYAEIVEY